MLEHPAGLALFDEAARVHHPELGADLAHDGEVVTDEDDGQPEPAAEVVDEGQDLRLHGHVERGRRLVAEQHGGIGGNRDRDRDALPQPAESW